MLSSTLKNCLALTAVLAALLAFDRALVPRDAKHSELAGLRAQARGLTKSPRADVLVLGSSTIGQWLTPKTLASVLKVQPKTILDGHLSACYATCSFSVAEKLKAQGRKFREVFLGANLFAMCAGGPTRVMQSLELSPVASLPTVLSVYGRSPRAATYLGTAAAMWVSHAYRDTTYQQARLENWAFGKGSEPKLWRLESTTPTSSRSERGRFGNCYYPPDKVVIQIAFLEEQLITLSEISEHIYLLSLPERSLSDVETDPQLATAWAEHRAALRSLAQKYKKVTLLDMTVGEIAHPRFFRDGAHLNSAGKRYQTKRLRKLLDASVGDDQ